MKKIVKEWECTWFSREDFAHEDKKKLTNEMGMFFIKKIADIRLDLDNHDKQQASTDRVSNYIVDIVDIHASSLVLSQEVHDLVRTSGEKSCGLDPIPTKLLLDCLDVLLPIISKMINYSLENGDFPLHGKVLWFCLCSRKMVWNLYIKIIGLSVIYSLCPNLLKVQLLNNSIITW